MKIVKRLHLNLVSSHLRFQFFYAPIRRAQCNSIQSYTNLNILFN